MIHQVPGRQRHADRGVGEALSRRCQNLGAGLDAAARQRNVRRHDDAAAPRPPGDPVVGGVGAGADDDLLDEGIAGDP